MPFYDLKCQECGHVFEKIMTITESSNPQTCEKCGKKNTRILIRNTDFVMTSRKGSHNIVPTSPVGSKAKQ